MARNPTVDEWFDETQHPQEDTMQLARNVILSTDARVEEAIKWKTPTFSYQGNIASFNPSKQFVSLLFHRGAEIPGDHPGLEGDGKLVRTMRFADVADLTARRAELESVIRAWCDWKSSG